MCDLWRMSLYADSPVQTSHWSGDSDAECRYVQGRRQQRVQVPDNQRHRRKVFLDGWANIFQGPQTARVPNNKGLYPIFFYNEVITVIGAVYKLCQISPHFIYANNDKNQLNRAALVPPSKLPLAGRRRISPPRLTNFRTNRQSEKRQAAVEGFLQEGF